MTKIVSSRSAVMLMVLAVGTVFYGGRVAADTVGSNAGNVWAQIKSLETQHKMDLANLDTQMGAFRSQIQEAQTSLKPLQAQRDTMVKQYEDQRAALMDQVEPGYLAAYQAEQQGLASAKSQKDQAIAAANAQYNTQHQQITAQFQSAIKGLKKG